MSRDLTRSRVRLRPDFGRVAEAVSRPGIDPRSWLAFARVDDDPDALVWDAELGWLVDVTIASGELVGEQVLARVPSATQGQGVTRAHPPHAGCLVAIAIPDGDPNNDVLIVGQLHDAECTPPETVNGDTIVERDAAEGEVAALETHIVAAPGEDLDEEYRNVRTRATATHRVLGESVELAEQDATQSYMRGQDFRDALDTFAEAVQEAFRLLAQSGATTAGGVPLTAAQAAYGTTPLLGIQKAVTDLGNAADAYLSDRIKGE